MPDAGRLQLPRSPRGVAHRPQPVGLSRDSERPGALLRVVDGLGFGSGLFDTTGDSVVDPVNRHYY